MITVQSTTTVIIFLLFMHCWLVANPCRLDANRGGCYQSMRIGAPILFPPNMPNRVHLLQPQCCCPYPRALRFKPIFSRNLAMVDRMIVPA